MQIPAHGFLHASPEPESVHGGMPRVQSHLANSMCTSSFPAPLNALPRCTHPVTSSAPHWSVLVALQWAGPYRFWGLVGWLVHVPCFSCILSQFLPHSAQKSFFLLPTFCVSGFCHFLGLFLSVCSALLGCWLYSSTFQTDLWQFS